MQIITKPGKGANIKLTKRESDLLANAAQLIEALGKHGNKSMTDAAVKATSSIAVLQYELSPESATVPY